ncbi:MAG: FeoA family protein [Erysipelotrichaceae bacterium]
MTLDEVSLNQMVEIVAIHNTGAIRRRLFDLGIMKHAMIQPVLQSPTNLMRAYRIHDTTIALRNIESIFIEVKYFYK